MNTSSNQFGLMVAYLLPGFIGLAGIAPFAPIVVTWLRPLNQAESSLGAPLYAMLAAFTFGMVVSCFRWLIIDHVHYWTGITSPTWDDARLGERVGAFDYLVDNHFRYHQFYGNSLIALVFAYPINRFIGTSTRLGILTDIGVSVVCVALFAGSRDALTKYYARTRRLMGQVVQKGRTEMTNGNHNDGGGAEISKPAAIQKPKPTPQSVPKPATSKNTPASK